MTEKEIKEFLEKENYIEEDLDFMWNACVSWEHKLISQLNSNGINWRHLSVCALRTLPNTFKKLRDKILNGDEESDTNN